MSIKKRSRKKVNPLPARAERLKSHSAVTVEGGIGSPDALGAKGMPQDELEYRTMLQEAILWVSKAVLEEQRADILLRAEERVKTLVELRG